MKRVKHATERLEVRTAEAEAMEAEELQNAMNQPPDGAAGAAAAAADESGAGGPADRNGALESAEANGEFNFLVNFGRQIHSTPPTSAPSSGEQRQHGFAKSFNNPAHSRSTHSDVSVTVECSLAV